MALLVTALNKYLQKVFTAAKPLDGYSTRIQTFVVSQSAVVRTRNEASAKVLGEASSFNLVGCTSPLLCHQPMSKNYRLVEAYDWLNRGSIGQTQPHAVFVFLPLIC